MNCYELRDIHQKKIAYFRTKRYDIYNFKEIFSFYICHFC